jgi:hypothetical protein
MTAVHRKSEIKCNISSRLPFITERNCVLSVVTNRTEDKVVDLKAKSRKVQDIKILAVQ